MSKLQHRLQDVIRGLVGISPLSICLGIRRPKALPVFQSDVLRAYRTGAHLRAPWILPRALMESNEPTNICIGENGISPDNESHYVIAELVAILKPRNAFEIGTFRGLVTSLVAMNMPEDGVLFTLDLPGNVMPEHASDLQYIKSSSEVGALFRDTTWMGKKIHQLRGDSLKFDFSPYVDRMEMVIVDASHTYPAVFSDSMNAFRMIKSGGVIVWHDYESMRSEYGVTRFVDELRQLHNCPTYRLSSAAGDTRYAALRVTDQIKQALMRLAENPASFSPK